MEKSIEELIYEEPEQRLNQILSPPCVQQRHIDSANVYPFLFCERSPLTLYPMDDRIIIESPGGAFIDQCAHLVDSFIDKADANDHPSRPALILCTDYVLTSLLM